MMKQNKPEESKWSVVCRRARLWEGRPQPGGLRSFLFLGGSDEGRLEHSGSVLRFTGKKQQIEIPVIENISEIRANVKLVHFILDFVATAMLLWLVLWISWPSGATRLLVSMTAALLGTSFYWWYLRKYGGWVWITYASFDGQSKDVGFWAAPVSGGSRKLYRDLSKLVTPSASHRD